MKKRILWALLCCLSLLSTEAFAQTTLAQETFEGIGTDFGYTSNTNAYRNVTVSVTTPTFMSAEYFFRQAFSTSGTAAYPGTTQPLTNKQGSYTWTAENVRGDAQTNVNPPGYVALNPITTSQNYKNFVITVAMAAPRGGTFTGAGSNSAYPSDRIRIQYSFNGGAWTTAAMLMGNNALGANQGGDMQQLTTLSDSTSVAAGNAPAGSGTVLDQAYRDIVATLPATALGTNLSVRVVLDTKAVELAFDNIRVTGTLDTTPKPTLSAIETAAASYTEGGSPVQLTNSLLVGYSDNSATNLTGGTVAIGGFVAGQDVLNFSNQNGITGSYNASTGVLTLTGATTQSNYQTALRSITYSNSNTTTATGGTRGLTFQVYNGATLSTTAARNLTVTAVLNAPVALNYTENFDTDGEGTRYFGNSFVNTASQVGFFRATNSPATYNGNTIGTTTFTGWSGGYWFGEGNDNVNNPGAPTSTLQLAPVNASGRVNLKFTIALASSSTWLGYFNTANPGDSFELYYRLNGGTPVKFGAFYGVNGSSAARQDADLDRTTPATGTLLTSALQDFTFDLPAAAAVGNLDFLLVQQARGTSEVAFDNIRITAASAPTVTTASASTITTTSATLGGNVTADGGDAVTSRGVLYSSTNTTPAIGGSGVTQDANGSGTGTFSKSIAGLTAGTTYYVRAYAINSIGTSYGATLSFTTQAITAAPVVAVPADGSLTNTATPTYGGTAVANSTVAVYVDGTSIGTTTASAAGNWSLTQPAALSQGSHTVRATAQASGQAVSANSNTNTFTVDSVPPTVVITSTAGASGGTTGTSPIPFTVTFSEAVTGFVAGDVAVTNGTLSGFSGSGTTYTFNVTPAGNGAVTVGVPVNVAQDQAGNGNTAASPFSITYNVVTVVSVTRQTPSPTATAQVNYQVVFSGSVTGLSVSNFSLTTSGISGASVSSVSGSGTTYTVVVNTGTGNGTLRLDVANSTGLAPAVTNTPYTTGEVYSITKSFAAAPQLTVQGTGGTGSDVTAFVDVVQVLSGGSAVANALQNPSFETHNPLANSNYGYNPTGASWTFNAQSGIAEAGSAFTPVTPIPNGIAVAFVQSNGAGNGQLQQNLALPTGTGYQVSFRTAQRICCTTLDQALNVFLNGVYLGTIQPPTNNAYSTFTSATFAVTAPALTATISSTASNPTTTSPIPFTVTFSQSVTGFTASAVTLTNGSLSGFAGSGSTYTFNVTPAANGAVTVNVPANSATDANNTGNTASSTYTITYSAPITAVTWNGSVSTDWFTAANWTGGVPTATLDALIPSGVPNMPLITTGTGTTKALTINAGASLTQTGGTLDVRADLTNNGTFAPTGGVVVMGTTAQTNGPNILGSSPIRFQDLTVNANGVLLSTASGASVQRVLTLNGSFTTQGNPFTLESNAAGTALAVNNGSSVILGNVTVQRYIDPSLNPGPGYRHFSSPVSTATVASLATGSFTPVVNAAYNSSATPNLVTPFPTVYGYDQSRLTLSNNLNAFDKGFFSPAALSDPLAVGQGYTVNLAANQTLRVTGPQNNGTITQSLSRNSGATAADAGWQLLGNPYPAPLDYSLVAPADRANLDAAIYIFNSTSQYGGQYRAYVNGVGGNPVLPVGQGFFARVSTGQTSGALTFRNSQRLTAPNSTGFQRSTSETRPLVQLTLRGATGTASDEAYVYLEAGATATLDAQYDAVKLPNTTGLNLASISAGTQLAINGLPIGSATTVTVPLFVGVPVSGTYTLMATQLLNFTAGAQPWLRDLQLGTLTDLSLTPTYAFTQNAASTAPRFELVFGPQQVLSAASAPLAAQVSIFPNPASKAVFVELPTALRTGVKATLVDALGRVVLTQALPAGRPTHALPLTNVATGVYLLRVQTDRGIVVKKLVVE